jgi:hypothetical protein
MVSVIGESGSIKRILSKEVLFEINVIKWLPIFMKGVFDFFLFVI